MGRGEPTLGAGTVRPSTFRKVEKTSFPSVAGVLEARLLRRWIVSSGALNILRCQRMLPSFLFRHSSIRSPDFSSVLMVKIRSPQVMGDACPVPGRGIFQAMLVPVFPFQLTGRSFSLLVPSPRGPRQACQFSPAAGGETVRRRRAASASAARSEGRGKPVDWARVY